ncbi:hypothetical protein G3R48_12250 [Shewanella intestini]|uniref:Uncharacterized protein n=1 Tax=Shewanella intestini TaxID=2017544 RepID=A0ABS5I4J2_9GAMM|nr:hypothetical protein [Shewanella intestini]MBR9728748.1 hypothetical protein [Shewanella intestini]
MFITPLPPSSINFPSMVIKKYPLDSKPSTFAATDIKSLLIPTFKPRKTAPRSTLPISASQQASKSASQQVSKSASQQVSKSASQQVSKSASQQVSKSKY